MTNIDEINEMLAELGIDKKISSRENIELIEDLIKRLDHLIKFALEVKDSEHIPTFAAAKLALYKIDRYKYKL